MLGHTREKKGGTTLEAEANEQGREKNIIHLGIPKEQN